MDLKNAARPAVLAAALALAAVSTTYLVNSTPRGADSAPSRETTSAPVASAGFAQPTESARRARVRRLGPPPYLQGTIRSLDDPTFAPHMAELGLRDPEEFLEAAPNLFYMLEADVGYKVPVVFVHGMGGSARDFAALVANLDRTRYKPWFFHYPSGMDLDQSAQLFHELFLSGLTILVRDMPMVIVAHDVGGLVAREALNLSGSHAGEARVRLLVTVATPFGGERAAERDDEASLVLDDEASLMLPVWRDLEPTGPFITRLFRKALPVGADHFAIYAYLNVDDLARGSAHDGVVPVSSQLSAAARRQFSRSVGFQASHSKILQDRAAIRWVISAIEEVTGSPSDADNPALAAGRP